MVVKRVYDLWPVNVVEWSPTRWLNVAAVLLVSASAVLLYASYWLSGTGWFPPKPKAFPRTLKLAALSLCRADLILLASPQKLRFLRTTPTSDGSFALGDTDNAGGTEEGEEEPLV